MKRIMQWLTKPPVDGPRSVLLLRLMVGGVFLWEGVLKFVYVNQGVGRFTKLGMPFPVFTADFVGGLEIVGGLLLMFGLLTRAIAIPFVIEMIVAMLSTKISLYLGTSPLPLPSAPPKIGIWAVLHEIRSEYAQIMVVLYLLINGQEDGRWTRFSPGCAQPRRVNLSDEMRCRDLCQEVRSCELVARQRAGSEEP